ncbi:DUF6053 domain-containing protein [Lysobacter yananisis]
MGGPSGPMLWCLVAATGPDSIGPEGSPTTASRRRDNARC